MSMKNYVIPQISGNFKLPAFAVNASCQQAWSDWKPRAFKNLYNNNKVNYQIQIDLI